MQNIGAVPNRGHVLIDKELLRKGWLEKPVCG